MRILGQILYVSNQITFLRLVLIPFVILAILYGKYHTAFYLVLAAGLTDGIDGVLARRLGQQSTLGRYLDPLADKFLLNACLLALTVVKEIPLWLTILVLSRDVIILATALVLILTTTRGVPLPTRIGKATTVALVITVLLTLLKHVISMEAVHALQYVGIYVTAALTTVSGTQYAWQTTRRLRGAEPAPALAVDMASFHDPARLPVPGAVAAAAEGLAGASARPGAHPVTKIPVVK